jgi:predicted DNA-binding transcriptional regulator AlpA
MHVKINKTQASDFLHISTRTFDRKINDGELPVGKKDVGSNQLYWYKDELLA